MNTDSDPLNRKTTKLPPIFRVNDMLHRRRAHFLASASIYGSSLRTP